MFIIPFATSLAYVLSLPIDGEHEPVAQKPTLTYPFSPSRAGPHNSLPSASTTPDFPPTVTVTLTVTAPNCTPVESDNKFSGNKITKVGSPTTLHEPTPFRKEGTSNGPATLPSSTPLNPSVITKIVGPGLGQLIQKAGITFPFDIFDFPESQQASQISQYFNIVVQETRTRGLESTVLVQSDNSSKPACGPFDSVNEYSGAFSIGQETKNFANSDGYSCFQTISHPASHIVSWVSQFNWSSSVNSFVRAQKKFNQSIPHIDSLPLVWNYTLTNVTQTEMDVGLHINLHSFNSQVSSPLTSTKASSNTTVRPALSTTHSAIFLNMTNPFGFSSSITPSLPTLTSVSQDPGRYFAQSDQSGIQSRVVASSVTPLSPGNTRHYDISTTAPPSTTSLTAFSPSSQFSGIYSVQTGQKVVQSSVVASSVTSVSCENTRHYNVSTTAPPSTTSLTASQFSGIYSVQTDQKLVQSSALAPSVTPLPPGNYTRQYNVSTAAAAPPSTTSVTAFNQLSGWEKFKVVVSIFFWSLRNQTGDNTQTRKVGEFTPSNCDTVFDILVTITVTMEKSISFCAQSPMVQVGLDVAEFLLHLVKIGLISGKETVDTIEAGNKVNSGCGKMETGAFALDLLPKKVL